MIGKVLKVNEFMYLESVIKTNGRSRTVVKKRLEAE